MQKALEASVNENLAIQAQLEQLAKQGDAAGKKQVCLYVVMYVSFFVIPFINVYSLTQTLFHQYNPSRPPSTPSTRATSPAPRLC